MVEQISRMTHFVLMENKALFYTLKKEVGSLCQSS
jgi:hypothetical protein